jgi:hypothetical protein
MPVLSGGRAEYERLYKWSIEAPADFWARVREATCAAMTT